MLTAPLQGGMEKYNHVIYIIDGRLIFNQSSITVEIKYF